MRIKTKTFCFALVSIVAVMFVIFLTAASNANSPQDINEIRSAIIGAEEVRIQMGMFSSDNGLTSSLSDTDLEALATAFDNRVDRYYAQGTYRNEFYKWLNRNYLFDTYQNTIDNCIDGGVTQCDITNIAFSENGMEAIVEVTITSWNKWVTLDEDGSYSISNPISQDFMELKLVKEDSYWKLKETLSLTLGPNGFDSALLEQANATASDANLAQANKSDAEKAQILSEIERSEEILSTKYSTFQEAKAAVEQIDVETGNYLALIK